MPVETKQVNWTDAALQAEVRAAARNYQDHMVKFLRDMIAIPSESCHEERVIARIKQEMEEAGFDEIKIDGLGNILGRVGSGPRVIAMDAHIDTVGVGDPEAWKVDPYQGDLKDGVIYGRGASDQEAGMAAMVWGAKIIKDLDLAGDCQIWVTGTVMEEDCDGLCWQYILREKVLAPEVVVSTEPTNLAVYRGHRGRMEITVRTKGVSCHGSAPERGVNAVYKMAPIIAAVEQLNEDLAAGADPFLGKGSVTISDVRSTSPSLCAVADSCTIHLDRRLTVGEDLEFAVKQIQDLPAVKAAGAEVAVLDYAETAYTGLVYPTKKYYPSWVVAQDHPAVQAGVVAARVANEAEPVVDKWIFSTNGTITCGMFGIPTIGFGPANEIYAHSVDDQCPVEHLVRAAAFYAAFPTAWSQSAGA
ncbi:MAG: YgeY family selenium metabolism-linked hydrolase [Candidatus Sericytochromatia bacterium]|nr:YgeY family selenium metabolism-linked hydrolase [Candidatus Tanganyikabacteria bacterium]